MNIESIGGKLRIYNIHGNIIGNSNSNSITKKEEKNG